MNPLDNFRLVTTKKNGNLYLVFSDLAVEGNLNTIEESKYLYTLYYENKALNEMVTYWHADHVYKHHPTAISAFWLTLMLVLNLFRAFLYLNIKPELRSKHSNLYFSRLICSELYDGSYQKVPP